MQLKNIRNFAKNIIYRKENKMLSVHKNLRQDGYKISVHNNRFDDGCWRSPIFAIYNKQKELFIFGCYTHDGELHIDKHREIEPSILEAIMNKVNKFFKKYNRGERNE